MLFSTKTRTACFFQLDRYMNPTHKIASKHLDTYARILTQNPNTESFPSSIKTQTATCFPSVKDQIELFFRRCAGMYCACNGNNLSLFLASVGSSYITPRLNFRIHVWTRDLHIVRHSTNAAYLFLYWSLKHQIVWGKGLFVPLFI